MKFTEAKLEQAFIELLENEGYPHFVGNSLVRSSKDEVLIEEDLKAYLLNRYQNVNLTETEAQSIILQLKTISSADLYESNKKIMQWLADGFILKREDRTQKDIHISLIDFAGLDRQRQSKDLDIIAAEPEVQYPADTNIYKFVNQLEIVGTERRIPDGILYINGLPVVVFEFKTAIQENTTIHNAFVQLTTRYKRDIPELFKYNAFCIISDGVNNKAGSFFAPYEFYYAWRRIAGLAKDLPVPRPGGGEFCVYILQCSDGSFYKGQTKDLKRRIKEHNEGKVSHTSKNLPVELIHWEYFYSREKAVKRESDLKTGYGRTWLKRSFEKKTLAKWARQTGVDGIDSMFTLVQGMLHKNRLRDIIQNFIYIPDSSKKDEKIVCRYPQYYAARSLYENIKIAEKPDGDGKGGTYFGATGSGKSFTMLYLTRLLMKSKHFESPTIVLITDRTDLDDQLAGQFTNAKQFIGDNTVESVESRADLRTKLQGRNSGGVFLTTIHKFTEDTELLTERTNVICISDEAHRSQTNLDQKVRVTSEGVKKTYGFAKYLHESLPNATFVGFTGTPIDATLDVFGKVVDAYTMTESVRDEITVRIVYEGRAAKVALHNSELEKIEKYYEEAAEAGANEYQIEESKKATATMNSILGDPDRLLKLAEDFVHHYENRVNEGATVKGKAIFVCSSREIGYEFYKNVIAYLGRRSSSFDKIDSTDYAQYFTKHFGYPDEWHAGKLPHRNKKGLIQSITFRLADSLPQTVLKDIEKEIQHLSDDKKDIEKRKKHQYWLDKGLGCCALADREMAQVVQEALLHHNGDKYDLLAWNIMPNHVHILIKTNDDLPKIIQSWKSFTGKWALDNNKKFNLGIDKDAKQFWMSDYWDRFIRDENHFNTAVRYILNNPVKANLPKNHTAYLFRGLMLDKGAKQELHPTQIKMIMTRGKDDPKEMHDLLGTKEHRKELDRQFKNEKSNFKIAIVVDMWLTGFDVPFLDSIYIDKPIRQHNLIQTISRVNRKFEGKNKGLVVDYIGIKKAMNMALAKYNKGERENFEDMQESLIVVRNHLDLLAKVLYKFDSSKYFGGAALEQLNTLNMAAEYVQLTKELETRFMGLVKRLKAAYDICAGSEHLTQNERDYTHFYLAVRSIVFKLTKGSAPDIAQMNAKVREMIKDALESDGVQEIFKLGDETQSEQDLFDEDYLAKIDKIKLPHTKIKLLQQLLAKAIGEIKKVNKVKGIDFSKKMQTLVERYNERKEDDVLRSEVYEEMAEHLTNLIWEVQKEFTAGDELGIDFEEKAFYDILKDLCIKYDFKYPEDKLIVLAQAVKDLVDSQAKYPDWSKREDIKSALKVGLIILLDEHGYPQ